MMTFFLSFGIYCTLALRNSRYHIWPLEECANTRIKGIFKKNCTHNTIQLGSIVRTYKADVYRYSPRKKKYTMTRNGAWDTVFINFKGTQPPGKQTQCNIQTDQIVIKLTVLGELLINLGFTIYQEIHQQSFT